MCLLHQSNPCLNIVLFLLKGQLSTRLELATSPATTALLKNQNKRMLITGKADQIAYGLSVHLL